MKPGKGQFTEVGPGCVSHPYLVQVCLLLPVAISTPRSVYKGLHPNTPLRGWHLPGSCLKAVGDRWRAGAPPLPPPPFYSGFPSTVCCFSTSGVIIVRCRGQVFPLSKSLLAEDGQEDDRVHCCLGANGRSLPFSGESKITRCRFSKSQDGTRVPPLSVQIGRYCQ